MLSDFCASVFTVDMTGFFIIPLIITEEEGVVSDIPCSRSLTPFLRLSLSLSVSSLPVTAPLLWL